jgi:hypothetical protein
MLENSRFWMEVNNTCWLSPLISRSRNRLLPHRWAQEDRGSICQWLTVPQASHIRWRGSKTHRRSWCRSGSVVLHASPLDHLETGGFPASTVARTHIHACMDGWMDGRRVVTSTSPWHVRLRISQAVRWAHTAQSCRLVPRPRAKGEEGQRTQTQPRCARRGHCAKKKKPNAAATTTRRGRRRWLSFLATSSCFDLV